jgi:hypothetical protein
VITVIRVHLLLLALLTAITPAWGQTARHFIYIVPSENGFETYITAALHKKNVPVTITKDEMQADLRLTSTQVSTEQVSTGRKVVNCLFAYCGGNEDKASTSVELVDKTGAVVWSYAVNKGRGKKNLQSMAEAIAKHLKDDYLMKAR